MEVKGAEILWLIDTWVNEFNWKEDDAREVIFKCDNEMLEISIRQTQILLKEKEQKIFNKMLKQKLIEKFKFWKKFRK